MAGGILIRSTGIVTRTGGVAVGNAGDPCCCGGAPLPPCTNCTGTQPSAIVSGTSGTLTPCAVTCAVNETYPYFGFNGTSSPPCRGVSCCFWAWTVTCGPLGMVVFLSHNNSSSEWDCAIGFFPGPTFYYLVTALPESSITCIGGVLTGTINVPANPSSICSGTAVVTFG